MQDVIIETDTINEIALLPWFFKTIQFRQMNLTHTENNPQTLNMKIDSTNTNDKNIYENKRKKKFK